MATTLFGQASVSRWGSNGATPRSLNEPVESLPQIALESIEPSGPDADDGITVSAPRRAGTASSGPTSAGSAPRFRFADLLHPDGTVDTDAVYRFGKVPPAKLSAEQLLQAMAKLPDALSDQDRQAMIAVMVKSLAHAAGIPVDSILADAWLRHTRLTQFQEALTSEFDHERQPLDQKVNDLESLIRAKEAELEAIRHELAERRTKAEPTHRDIGVKLSRLQEVIQLLESTR